MKSGLCRLCVWLAAVPCAGVAAAEIKWGHAVHREHSEVDVASRDLAGRPEFSAPGTAYVFLAVGHPTELARQAEVRLAEDDVRRTVNAALHARGFVPAQDRAAVKLGIAVAYGVGVLRPPYAFFRIDPDLETYRTWPAALQRLHRLYYAGTADDDETDRADTAEPVNYIKITAYDFARFTREKKLHAVWATLITMPAKQKPLPEHFGRMVAAAAPLLGSEARDGRTFDVATPRGDVEIGPVRVVPPDEPAPPPR